MAIHADAEGQDAGTEDGEAGGILVAAADQNARAVPQLGNPGIGQDKRAVSRVYSDDLNANTLATQEDDAVAAADGVTKPVGLGQNLVKDGCLIAPEGDSVTPSGGLAL